MVGYRVVNAINLLTIRTAMSATLHVEKALADYAHQLFDRYVNDAHKWF